MSKKTNPTKRSSRKPSRNSRAKADNRRPDAGITEHEEKGGPHDNDVEWYAGDEYLLADSARLPFSNPAGFATDVDVVSSWTAQGPVTGKVPFSVPAICTIHLAPTVGADTGASSPINTQAQRVFGFIRAQQTVSSAYNQVTLMMYLVSLTALYSFYAFCSRLYGLLGTYQFRNRALPKALMQAMGINFSDFEKEKANFRYWLNDFGNSVGALALPADMSYTKRQMWLYQNVFKDGLNEKSQLYMYVPEYFFMYNPIGHVVGELNTPSLEYISYKEYSEVAGGITFEKLREMGETMLARLFNNKVINAISGDLVKAYGYERIWQLLPLGEDYIVEPTLELNVLDQIHNLFIPANGMRFGEWMTDQRFRKDVAWEEVDEATATSYLKPNYHVNTHISTAAIPTSEFYMRTWGKSGMFIDFDKQDVTPADVMVATRLSAVGYNYPAAGTDLAIPESGTILCGSEVATRLQVWQAMPDNNTFVARNVQTVATDVNAGSIIRAFYKHPIITAFNYDDVTATWVKVASDIENWTFLNVSDLFKLHETALKSEFKVPLIGRLMKQ